LKHSSDELQVSERAVLKHARLQIKSLSLWDLLQGFLQLLSQGSATFP